MFEYCEKSLNKHFLKFFTTDRIYFSHYLKKNAKIQFFKKNSSGHKNSLPGIKPKVIILMKKRF